MVTVLVMGGIETAAVDEVELEPELEEAEPDEPELEESEPVEPELDEPELEESEPDAEEVVVVAAPVEVATALDGAEEDAPVAAAPVSVAVTGQMVVYDTTTEVTTFWV